MLSAKEPPLRLSHCRTARWKLCRPSRSAYVLSGCSLHADSRVHRYLRRMIADAKAKQATIIISSQTPNNPYEFVLLLGAIILSVDSPGIALYRNSDTIVNSPPRFVPYAKNLATAAGVPYVDHFAAAISLFTKLGKATTEGYYPIDHTHTNEAGANQMAWAFLSGLKCPSAQSALATYVNSAGQGAGARC